MDSSEPPLPPYNYSSLTAMKEKTPLNQVMTLKASNMQRVIQVVQRMAQKSCRRAFQFLCCPIETLWCEKVTCCPDGKHQHTENKTTEETPVAPWNPPSTILIVNISNSTLIDCVIGNDTYPSTVTESQPLMQEPQHHVHDHLRCSYSHVQQGAAQTSSPPPPSSLPYPLPLAEEAPSISIHSSHLSCVIIGDNNYMHAADPGD